jgi:hypothetical protein
MVFLLSGSLLAYALEALGVSSAFMKLAVIFIVLFLITRIIILVRIVFKK